LESFIDCSSRSSLFYLRLITKVLHNCFLTWGSICLILPDTAGSLRTSFYLKSNNCVWFIHNISYLSLVELQLWMYIAQPWLSSIKKKPTISQKKKFIWTCFSKLLPASLGCPFLINAVVTSLSWMSQFQQVYKFSYKKYNKQSGTTLGYCCCKDVKGKWCFASFNSNRHKQPLDYPLFMLIRPSKDVKILQF
jgi:hypothetical protein